MAILNNLLDEYKGTIYRQTMFAEFEREMHKRNEEGIPLTNDTLCDYYYNLNKLYFGPKVKLDKEIKYEWARIPHFYNSFYVYKYATSMSAATYIADKIISGDQEFRDKYLNFLKLGSSMYPNEELKTLGIDMAKSTVVDAALTKFGELTKELQKLTDKGE
jgi:oligoendopeptidase F